MPCPFILQELLDLIIDDLHDDPKTLNTCFLMSKAWVLRARKYLFLEFTFTSFDQRILLSRGEPFRIPQPLLLTIYEL